MSSTRDDKPERPAADSRARALTPYQPARPEETTRQTLPGLARITTNRNYGT